MPDPLLNQSTLTSLGGTYEMGAVWGELETAVRQRLYQTVEGQWRALRWRAADDPFAATSLADDLASALAMHLRHAAENLATPSADPFPAAAKPIIASYLTRRMEPQPFSRVAERDW